MARNARGSRGTRETTNSAWFRFASECAQEHATERKGGEGKGGVCSRNNLHASPFRTFDVSGFSKRGYIVANIAKRKREREREEEKKKRLMQLRGKFHPLLGKVRRIGIRKLKSRRSQCYRYQSGFDPSHDWSWKLWSFPHSTLSDDCEGSSASPWLIREFFCSSSFFFLSVYQKFFERAKDIDLLDSFPLLFSFFSRQNQIRRKLNEGNLG